MTDRNRANIKLPREDWETLAARKPDDETWAAWLLEVSEDA